MEGGAERGIGAAQELGVEEREAVGGGSKVQE